MYRRHHLEILKDRIAEPRHFIQVLAGPRQVGKSTLVKQMIAEIDLPYTFEVADSVNSTDTDWIRRVWQSARSRMEFQMNREYLLVIDEIQKIDNWSEAVKREWDLDTFNDLNIKVVILGSSRLLLKQGLTESLAGRFELIRMGHWTYKEMHEAFGWNLNQYIYFGGYPGGAGLINKESRWKSYIKDAIVEPAIAKDVLMTKTIYKPALIRQLFEVGSSYSGELLSLNKLLGQLQDAGNVTTLAGYLQILDECNLLTGLNKYANDIARKYNSIPKFQVYNSALLTVFAGRTFEKEFTDPMRWGRWVESAVGSYIVGQADECDYKVYYWRERDNEVDFILAKRGNVAAIEVKSGRRTMNSGLPMFTKLFSPQKAFIVGSGGIPVEEFLKLDLNRLFV